MKNVTNTENLRVAVRVRPILPNERLRETVVYTEPNDDRKIRIQKDTNFYEGYFDKVFRPVSTQREIFDFVNDQLSDVIDGVNSTILTYGQTGSGKTYTMFGSDWTLNDSNLKIAKILKDKDNFLKHEFIINPFSEGNGIILRCITKIFSSIQSNKNNKFTVSCSFLQIYNEKIYDLLEDTPLNEHMIDVKDRKKDFNVFMNNNTLNKDLDQRSLNIREDKINGVYVDGLTDFIVENVYDCASLLKKGENNRKKRHTTKNEMSSRSHTLLMITLGDNKVHQNGTIKKSKLCLCDLAGSEKYDQDNSHKSKHFNEMTSINLSLTALGKVIYSLSNKSSHVPYRDSKLTRLLQNSLGGNTRTSFIVNVAPTEDHYEETFSTLKFADRAKSVFVKIKPNEIIANDENMLNKLINEINALKQILSLRKRRGQIQDIETQFYKLKEENEKLKQFYNTNENIEKLIEENKFLKLELQKLKSELKTDEFNFDEKLSKNKSENSDWSLKKTYLNNDISENKLINAGSNIMMSLNSLNKIYNPGTGPGLVLQSEWTTSKDLNERKKKNERLKYLEELEKKNGMQIVKEMQRIENEKFKKIEEKNKKINENIIKKKKMDGHINRLNYLYKNNSNIHSEYLAESVKRSFEGGRLNRNNNYEAFIDSNEILSNKILNKYDTYKFSAMNK